MQNTTFITLPGHATAARARTRPANLFGHLAAWLRGWKAQRSTLDELRHLDDATLRDIGVTRWQLYSGLEAERARRTAQTGRLHG
jgi:uncharacterized protein YjiS (DUF1127 family)